MTAAEEEAPAAAAAVAAEAGKGKGGEMMSRTSIKMLDTQTPLTEQDIREAEERLQYRIPAEYRAFLLVYNSGYPERQNFSLSPGGAKDYSVEYFYGLKVSYGTNLESILTTYRDRMPGEMFPFARCGGCQICLCTAGNNTGKVYFWDSEEENPDEPQPCYDNLYLIANSFDEFLAGLS